MLGADRHTRFTARVAGRYGRRAVSRPPLGIVFRRREPPAVPHAVVVQMPVQVRFEPRIRLTLLGAPRGPEQSRPAPQPGTHTTAELPMHTRTHARSERFLERVVSRGLRVERITAGSRPQLPGPSGPPSWEQPDGRSPRHDPPPAWAVPHAVRSGVVVRAARVPAPTQGPTLEAEAIAELTRPLAEAVRRATAQPDVERLTDRVIASIDRRIVAHGERLGRA